MSIVVVGPYCDPTVVKVDEHTELCFSSQHKGLITTIIWQKRKRKSMKAELTALAEQKETMSWWERESRHLNFSPCFLLLVRWVVPSVRPAIGAHSQNGARNFPLLTSLWLIFNLLSLPYHVSQSTPSKWIVPSRLSGVGRGIIRFCWFHSCVEDFGTSFL